jgi:hypothetical protein
MITNTVILISTITPISINCLIRLLNFRLNGPDACLKIDRTKDNIDMATYTLCILITTD